MKRLDTLLRQQDGEKVMQFIADPRFSGIPPSLMMKEIAPPFNEIFTYYLESQKEYSQRNYNRAYEKFEASFQKLNTYVKGDSTQWTVPLLKHMVFGFRRSAEQTRNIKYLNSCSRILMNSFGSLLDREQDFYKSKKQLLLLLTNNLFKLYFKLNTLNLCSHLIKPLEQQHAKLFNFYSKAEMVTYRYYSGTIALFEANYQQALDFLQHAYQHCHAGKKYWHNRQMILKRLICVKMLFGVYPTDDLLQNYRLEIFQDLKNAIKNGNVTLFNKQVQTHLNTWIKWGLYLIIEKLRQNMFKNFVKRIYTIVNSTRVKLEAIKICLKKMGQDIEVEEIEAILANLIFNGFIQGYISHEHATLVLSKQNPFPSLK